MTSISRNSVVSLLFVASLLSGCVATDSAPPAAPLPTSTTYDAPKDKVWPLIVNEIGLEYPVRAIEKESGLITTDFVTLDAGFDNMNAQRWIYPPSVMLGTWAGLRMSLKILAVEPEPGKTMVTIKCHYEAFENNVSHSWMVADSNGSLENGILTRIRAQLPAPK